MGVGSYVLEFGDRSDKSDVDRQTASAQLLKLLARQPMSFMSLISISGFPEPLLRECLRDLRQRELVEGNDEQWRLTPLGYKAEMVVAA
jgi:hypothetical protein